MNFVVNLEYKPYVPTYRRLSDALRKIILESRLKPGDPFPSVRDLSSSLNLARATVIKSLRDLEKQGFIKTVPGSGTFVSSELPGDLSDLVAGAPPDEVPLRSIQLSDYGRRISQMRHEEEDCWSVHLSEINYGGPPLDLAPLTQWRSLLLHYCTRTELSPLYATIEPNGYPPLREALAAFFHRTRSIRCKSDDVIVCSSKQLRLDLIGRIVLRPGDCVAFENPGYPEARIALKSHGAAIIPVPVDDGGMNVDYLADLRQRIKLVYVSPSHQDPTGATLSMERRMKLLKWAWSNGVYIIEDDYDSEYRYGGKPLPSLKALDQGDCVFHISTFWKVMFQILRYGFVIAPRHLSREFRLAKFQLERYLPLWEQLALTDFVNGGHIELHIKKTQPTYARRRQALLYALTKYFGTHVKIARESAGMHVLVRFEECLDGSALLRLASECGVKILSTRPWYVEAPVENEYIMPFAESQPEEIERGIRQLAELMSKREGMIAPS